MLVKIYLSINDKDSNSFFMSNFTSLFFDRLILGWWVGMGAWKNEGSFGFSLR